MAPTRILTTIVILTAVLYLLVRLGKIPKPKKLSYLAKTSFVLIITGIIFGNNRTLSYILIGSGMALAAVDIAKSPRK